MISIVIEYGNTSVRFSHAWVEKIIRFVLRKEECGSAELGVKFVDDKEMRACNLKHRKKNAPTDVLSFGYSQSPLEGDIMIDIDEIRRMMRVSHRLMREQVGMLLIHGLLHCLGYDHARDVERRQMWKKQDAYAKQLHTEQIAFEDFG